MAERNLQRASESRQEVFRVETPSPILSTEQQMLALVSDINRKLILISTRLAALRTDVDALIAKGGK